MIKNLEFPFPASSRPLSTCITMPLKKEVLSNQDLSATFRQRSWIFMAKTKKALEKYPIKTLVVAGGVAANQGLRERLAAGQSLK